MQKCRQHICLPTKLIDLIDFIDKIHTYTVCRLPISLCGNPCIVMASHYISYMFFKSNHHISWMPSSHGSMERTQKAGDEITCMINNILMHEPVISLIGYMDIHQFGLDIYMPILVKPAWKQFCIVVIIIYIYIYNNHSPTLHCNNNTGRPYSLFRWDIEFDQLQKSISGVRVVQRPLASKSVDVPSIVLSSNRDQAK